MAVKYRNAPLSEIVLGIFFKTNTLIRHSIIFTLVDNLSKEYSIINTHPVSPEEQIIDNSIQNALDYGKAGFSVYQLSSPTSKLQILIQQNFITLHWARRDNESVGDYPGFAFIYNEFVNIINHIKSLFVKFDDDFEKDMSSFYLSYADRVDFEDYKKNNQKITDIININLPYFKLGENTFTANNCICRYSIPCNEVNGHALITVNSPTLASNQLLIVENKIKGKATNIEEMKNWFDVAHKIQHSFFEIFFKENILNSWL